MLTRGCRALVLSQVLRSWVTPHVLERSEFMVPRLGGVQWRSGVSIMLGTLHEAV